jgi:hypothetical protein
VEGDGRYAERVLAGWELGSASEFDTADPGEALRPRRPDADVEACVTFHETSATNKGAEFTKNGRDRRPTISDHGLESFMILVRAAIYS